MRTKSTGRIRIWIYLVSWIVHYLWNSTSATTIYDSIIDSKLIKWVKNNNWSRSTCGRKKSRNSCRKQQLNFQLKFCIDCVFSLRESLFCVFLLLARPLIHTHTHINNYTHTHTKSHSLTHLLSLNFKFDFSIFRQHPRFHFHALNFVCFTSICYCRHQVQFQ